MKAVTMIGVVALMVVVLVLGTACAGKNGVGIESIEDNYNGTFTIYLTDGSSFTSSDLPGLQGEKGDKGDKGDQGLQGIQGPAGEMPDLEWHYVTTFTGTGDLITSSFSIPGDDFRLTWFVDPDTSSGGAFLLAAKGQSDDSIVDLVSLYPLEGLILSGVEYVRVGGQRFYLDITCFGVDEWTVYVDALY